MHQQVNPYFNAYGGPGGPPPDAGGVGPAIEAAIQVIHEAHLDYYLSKPWTPPEEDPYPLVDDLLDAWPAEHAPEAKGLRLVGHQWSARSHGIKDFLASNLICYLWLDVTREPGAREVPTEGKPGHSTAFSAALIVASGSISVSGASSRGTAP